MFAPVGDSGKFLMEGNSKLVEAADNHHIMERANNSGVANVVSKRERKQEKRMKRLLLQILEMQCEYMDYLEYCVQ